MTDAPVYIQNLIGPKEDVILKAMAHPALAVKRKPTIDQALKAVAREVEFTARQHVTANLTPVIQDMYDTYVLVNGEYEQDVGPDQSAYLQRISEYSEGLDNRLEAVIEPWEPYFSADWLGVNTIDTRLWEEDAIPKLVESASKEVYKQLAYDKTPAQILANAGIVQADVELFLEQHLAGTLIQPTESTTMQTVSTIANAIRKQVGTAESGFDIMAVNDDIAMVAEGDDEILVGGAAARLGIDQEQVDALQTMALTMAFEDVAEQLVNAIKNPSSAAVQDVGAVPTKTKAKTTANGKKTTPAPALGATAVAGQIGKDVFALIKEHSGAKDTDLSAALGVSRATYNNWYNGKTPCHATSDQRRLVRDQIVINTNGLLKALAILDGSAEAMAVE